MKRLSFFFKSVIFLSVSLIVFLSLISFSSKDISLVSSPRSQVTHNLIGIGGAYFAFVLFFLFGYASYFVPFYLFSHGLDKLEILRFWGLGRSKVVNAISFSLFIVSLSVFIGLFFEEGAKLFRSSGIIGFYLSPVLKKYLGIYGSILFTFLILAVSSLLLFGFFFADLFSAVKRCLIALIEFLKKPKAKLPKERIVKITEAKTPFFDYKEKIPKKIKPEIKVYTPKIEAKTPFETPQPKVQEKVLSEGVKVKEEPLAVSARKHFDPNDYQLPAPEILKVPPAPDHRELKEDIEANIKNLEETLSDFSVEAKVVSVQKGPVVTMYELHPQAGVKIQKISALADDIALAMKSSQVRVVAPLPGRGTVGVEVPNTKKHLVYLREVIEEKTFIKSSSRLTLAIGKDVAGAPVVADLKEMPHLLIAGTTGSGKTVCVNSIISSIIFKSKPNEAKFILIDPKMVELAVFAAIPHLIHPIISDAKKAFFALSWAVEEMEKRYQLLADAGVRNIDAYNHESTKIPYIIIVVDELADLMVVAKENIESSIQRLAQLSRAVGIHLILATQRPSVDVVTGVIKANFPARISFKVSSKIDSRTVLDAMGGEKLLGKGDLLFLKPGAPKMIRAQGCFVDDEDIEALANFIKAQGVPVYEEGIVEAEKKRAFSVESDELLDEATKTILQSRQASASILQRRLRVGYTRAARLLDLMEQAGIVGPFCGSKAREILIDADEFMKEKGWL